ncbi:MAG: response regulator [Rhodospirillaceae bacterium]|nr:response regulator [Rhodospirillaceae bacterium]
MTTLSEEIVNSRILVVDDNLTNVVLLKKLLEGSGYNDVTGITDSREVKSLYEESSFDLVLLDIRMPHLDGFDVMNQLREIDSALPPNIMVLTAQTDQETKLKALDFGARDFLHKPFDRLEVLTRIRNMIETHLLHKKMLMQNDILEQKVEERTREIQETRLEVVRCLGRASEYKDNETGMHVIRMSKMSQIIAREAGMSEADCELILHASPMHDVGKIGIPDAVLLKPGKLDADEWEVMKRHAEMGVEILGDHPSPLMEMARQVAHTHHEKWDGSGYPRGLSGENIPLVGRITALADVFDALTSERPYKEAWPVEKAVDLIKEQSGKHFDPELVEIFLKLIDKLCDIRDQYRDDFNTEAAE